MRHRVKTKTLQRNTKQRQALLKGLLRSLVANGKIVTTEVKAKETKRLAEKLIHKAQTDSVPVRRDLHRFFGSRDVVNTLVDKIGPVFKKRQSGFTTLKKQTKRRGDNALMVELSLIEMPAEMGTLKTPEAKKQTRQPKKVVKKPVPKTARQAKPKKTAQKKSTLVDKNKKSDKK